MTMMPGSGEPGQPGQPARGQQGGAGGAGGTGGEGQQTGGEGGPGGTGGIGGSAAGHNLQVGLRRLAFMTIALYLLLAGVFALGWYENHKSHDALCKFDRNLAAQIVSTQAYLDAVDAGKRTLPSGVSRRDIAAPLERQRSTLASLEGLGCSDNPIPLSKEAQ